LSISRRNWLFEARVTVTPVYQWSGLHDFALPMHDLGLAMLSK
jgi:hypothetical protein